MNTRFLPTTESRFLNGQNMSTNDPAIAGLIPKTMMRKLALFFVLIIFSLSSAVAQTPPDGPITTLPEIVVPMQTYPVAVNVPIVVEDFNLVGAVSLTMDYDPNVITFTGVTDSAFAGFSVVADPLLGQVVIGWFSTINGLGFTVPDGTPLITLGFDYHGGSTTLVFNDDLNGCEYADENKDFYNDLPYGNFYFNGFITDLNASATYTNICAPSNIGEITVNAAGGSGVYQYSLNGGAWEPLTPTAPFTPYTFSNLSPDVYEVSVRDVVSVTTTTPIANITLTPLTPPLHNVTQNTYHCFIQDAVDNATSGDVINQVVFPWTFTENVTINKMVTLNGNPADQTQSVVSGGGTGTVLNITADGVILSGWSVIGSGSNAGDAAIHLNDVSNVNIQNNVIGGSENGFLVSGSFNAGNTIANNIIDGNTYGMALNLLDPNERAVVGMNYWGDADGPLQAIYNTCGGGDEVTSMVMYHPWYTTDALAATQTATLPIYNIDKDRWYCTIQDASDHADDNETIEFLYAGNYGNLVFDYASATKTVQINNASAGVVTMHGASSALTVANGTLGFNGVDFTTATDDPTVQINDGKLILRNCNVYESTGFANVGVVIAGGELDAGTAVTDPGHNRFLVSGSGIAMNNTGGVAEAICNHWGSILYAAIFPVVQGTVNFDPWSDYNFTMCDVLTRLNGPITWVEEHIEPCTGVTTTVSIPVYVDQFRNIDAISLTLDFNPAVLQLTGSTPGLGFSAMSVVPDNANGRVVVGWFSTTMVSTYPSSVPLVTLHFDYSGGTSLLEWFDGFGTNSEYQNALIQYPYIDEPQEDFYIDGWITDLNATVASTNVVCYGTSSGTITITSLCGSTNYEYSINGGTDWYPTHVFNVPAGIYDVWVRDADFPAAKLQLDPALEILQPAAPLAATANWTKRVRCKGESNGKAIVNPTGGWGGYTYLWSDPAGQTTQEAVGLAAGYYTVTVTDIGGCEEVVGTFVIEPTIAFTASVSSTVVSCKGGSDGTITVNGANGWGYYMYSIDNVTYFNYLTSNTITGVPAGNYTLQIFDDELCELFLPISVIEPVDPLTITATMTQPVSCYGFTDGEITASATGGWSALGPYEYSLDNTTWQLSPVFDNLAAGTYDVYVRDFHNCVVQTSIVVTQPAPFTAAISGSTTICSGESATVTIDIVGGNMPYDITLTDGVNAHVVTGHNSLSYSFTQPYTATTTWSWGVITDANSCPAVSSGDATITVNPLPALGFTFKSLAATGSVFEYCATETVEVTLSDIWVGTAPFDIEWTVFDGSVTATYTETGVNLNDVIFSSLLSPGTYVVNITGITDANGCSPDDYSPYNATVVVHPAAAPGFSFNGTLAGTGDAFTYCYDETVEVTLSHIWAGTAPFDVEWTVTEGSVTTTYNATGLGLNDFLYNNTFAPGTYTIQITSVVDANGCTPFDYAPYLAYVTVHEEPMFSFGFNGVEAGHNATFAYCYDETVEVTLFEYYGGIAPYDVTFEVNGVTSTVTGLSKGDVIAAAQTYPPGVYNIVVTDITDATGCKASAAFLSVAQATLTINEEPMFSFGFNGYEAPHNATFEFCYDTPVEVTLFAEYGGTAPYSVTYEVNGVTSTVTGLSLGDVISASQLYPAGVYNIVVTDITDANGCKASATFLAVAQATITIHEEPMISFGFNGVEAGHNATFEYCYDESVGVTLYNYYGGTAPYSVTYELNGVTSTVTGLELGDVIAAAQTYPAGVYNIVVTDITDANGCKASAAFLALAQATITINPMPEVNFLMNTTVLDYPVSAVGICYNENIEFRLNTIKQGDAPFNISWDVFVNGNTIADPTLSGSASGLLSGDLMFSAAGPHVPGDYFVQITSLQDGNGCEVPSTVLNTYYNATITVNPEPAIGFSFNGNLAATGSHFDYCFSDIIEVTVSDVWSGDLPLDVTYTVDDGSVTTTYGPITIANLNDVLYSGTMAAGNYTIQLTNIVDGNGCSPADYSPYVATVEVHSYVVSGTFNYYNAGLTALNNITVELTQGTTTLYTVTTDANGDYTFPAVCPGTYEVIASTIKPTGGINSSDAVLVNKWGVTSSTIEKVEFLAGDVDNSGIITSFDAFEVLKHFVEFPNYSFSPEWVFWPSYDFISGNPFPGSQIPTVQVTTADLILNFYGLVSGDFNRNFTPGNAKSNGSVNLSQNGSALLGDGDEMVIPVTAEDAMDITAISLILNYPADKIEVVDVTLANNAPLMYSTNNGQLRIGYSALMPFVVKQSDPVIFIRVKGLANLTSNEKASFVLAQDPLNEITDMYYQVIPMANLSILSLEGTVGLEKNNVDPALTLSNVPNPFVHSTVISYEIPAQGMVSLDLYDMTGRNIAQLFHGNQSQGKHAVTLDDQHITPGVYMVTLRVATPQGVINRTIRVVKN